MHLQEFNRHCEITGKHSEHTFTGNCSKKEKKHTLEFAITKKEITSTQLTRNTTHTRGAFLGCVV
jgi:hypothetical protein